MRHIVGFLVGLILAPVVMLGTGWALPRLVDLNAAGGSFVSTTGLMAVGALGGVALLVGLGVAAPRLTPLLPGVAGLTLVGLTAVDHLRPELSGRLPQVPGAEGALTLLPLGVYLPLSVALVVPLFVPSRWVRREADPTLTEEEYFDGLYEEDDEDVAGAHAPRGRRHRAV